MIFLKNKKILHISSSIRGGAGIASYRMHNSLIKNGYNSSLYIKNYSETNYPKNIFFSNSCFFFKIKKIVKLILPSNIHFYLKNFFFKKEINPFCFYQKNELNKKGLDKNFLNVVRKYDILFVHWVSDFINTHDLDKIFSFKSIKIIFVMLDHAHITGGCHFSLNCEKFQSTCLNCPALRKKNSLAHLQLIEKSDKIKRFKADLITFSKTDLKLAKSSKIKFKKYLKTTIPIELDEFDLTRSKMNNNKYLFSCAFNFEDERKGVSYFIKVLDHLDKKLKNKKITVLCTNVPSDLEIKYNNINFEKFNYDDDPKEYSKIYKKADVFVFTSIADSAPQMPVESLICGTPVVSFEVANLKEVITEKNDGIIVSNLNTSYMAEKIYHILYSKFFHEDKQIKKRSLKAIKNHSQKKFLRDLNKFLA